MTDLYVTDFSPEVAKGMRYVEDGYLDQAWHLFSQLDHDHPKNPVIQSYLGLLTAIRNNDPSKGIRICRDALSRDSKEALLYLNLGKAYLHAGQRYEAVLTVRKGLRLRSPYRGLLTHFFRMVGVRRKPPLRFLKRDNPLNKYLGKLTWKLGNGKTVRRPIGSGGRG